MRPTQIRLGTPLARAVPPSGLPPCETTLIHRGGLAAPSADDQAAAYGTGPAGNEYPGGYWTTALPHNEHPFWPSTGYALPGPWEGYLGYATWNGHLDPKPQLSTASPHAGTYGFYLPGPSSGGVALVGGVYCSGAVRTLGYSLVNPSESVQLACQFKTPSVETGVHTEIRFYDAAGQFLADQQSATNTAVPNVYGPATDTAVAPAGSVFFQATLNFFRDFPAPFVDLYVDSITVAIT